MDKNYLITMRPLQPFFFGGERVFKGNGENDSFFARQNPYFIRSQLTPNQSTLFGVLRFIGISDITKGFQAPIDSVTVGSKSFDLNSESQQSFGYIKGISPLLLEKNGGLYIPAPFIGNGLETDAHTCYINGKKYEGIKYPEGWSAKNDGLENSWLEIESGAKIASEKIFGTKVFSHNKKGADEDGFFKKECCYLKDDYRFAFIATVDEKFSFNNKIAYFGQKKTPFAIGVKGCDKNDIEQKIWHSIQPHAAYAWSDILWKGQDLYEYVNYAAVKTKSYRGISNNRRHKNILKLLEKGSVFYLKEGREGDFINAISNANAEIAGFNKIIIGERK
jgi:hypothetical protein